MNGWRQYLAHRKLLDNAGQPSTFTLQFGFRGRVLKLGVYRVDYHRVQRRRSEAIQELVVPPPQSGTLRRFSRAR